MSGSRLSALRHEYDILRTGVIAAAYGRPSAEVMRLGRFAERLIDMLGSTAEIIEEAENGLAESRAILSEETVAGRGTWTGEDDNG